MKSYYVWDDGIETCYNNDRDSACEAVQEAKKDGRNAYIFQKQVLSLFYNMQQKRG